MFPNALHTASRRILCLGALLLLLGSSVSAQAWWNKEWTVRKAFTIDTTAEGGAITDAIGDTVVLVRLHQGNFQFDQAKEDGSDIRFVAGDDKTVLPSHIEKYDGLMNEAFVWVKVPGVKPGAKTPIWLYYGNSGDISSKTDTKATYDDSDLLVYHFAEQGTPAHDSGTHGNNAETAGTASQGALIGSGLRLLGKAITIPAAPAFNWNDGAPLTWSAWIKPSNLAANAVIFSRKDARGSFEIGLDQGVPYVEVTNAAGKQRSAAGAPLPAGSWKQLTAVAEGSTVTLYVDGEVYAKLNAPLPALTGPAYIGGTAPDGPIGFVGEIDELEISQAAKTSGAVKLAAIGESGSDKAGKLLAAGEDESSGGGGHNEVLEQLSMFGEISKSLSFDGWAVIGLCSIMAVIGWFVAIRKFFVLNRIKKGSDTFIKQWQSVASDLTQLDHSDAENVKSLGGGATAAAQKLMRMSPVYHIYHIGSEEIRHRLARDSGTKLGLSSRSIQAIRASLDGGLVREVQSLNGDLIFLTISIAGGPYLGLLGTVIGVMITFATIAKTGTVEVNSIAPGIAGALLATVAGLVVAIPALFAYSYLSARIKDTVNTMHLFIDEFVSKMAEFYPAGSE